MQLSVKDDGAPAGPVRTGSVKNNGFATGPAVATIGAGATIIADLVIGSVVNATVTSTFNRHRRNVWHGRFIKDG